MKTLNEKQKLTLKDKLEVLKEKQDDEMNVLEMEAMDFIVGGVKCKKDYTSSGCKCGYDGPTLASYSI